MASKNPVVNLFVNFWRYSKGNRTNVVVFFTLELVANILMLGNPIAVSRAFNDVQFSSSDPRLLYYLIANLSILVVIILAFWALHGVSRVMENKNGFWVRKKYKQEMVSQILALPLDWHKQHHSGETIDKMNKSAESLFNFSVTTFMINTSLVRTAGSLIAMFLFDKWSAFIALIFTALAVISMLKFDATMRKAFLRMYKFENRLASAVHDYISNIFSIITLRLEGRVNREVAERAEGAFPDYTKNIITNEYKWFTIGFFTTFMTFVVLSLNAFLSFKHTGVIIIGTLFALYTYLQNIGSVFSNFAIQYGKIVEQDTAIRAADAIREEYKKLGKHEDHSLPEQWKTLEIQKLSFAYTNEAGGINQYKHLDNVDITIERNQKIAFIGESGSGKSTTLALLRGLYKPEHAHVTADGVALPSGLSALYGHVTLIPQEPELFNSTVEDNITMDTKADPEILRKVIQLAQFESVLERLPSGLATNVMEKGVSFSGGEKQRLALARGLLAGYNSDFVFMDEPTSSVDFTNEMKIYENVLAEFSDKTVISTVHNLSLLKYFDSIYLFKTGVVIAHGTFTELKKHPAFKTLWQNYNKSIK